MSDERYIGVELECPSERLAKFFAESPIWRDIVRIIDENVEKGISDLEDIDTTGDLLQFSRGKLNQLRLFRDLGTVMITHAREQEGLETDQEESEDG